MSRNFTVRSFSAGCAAFAVFLFFAILVRAGGTAELITQRCQGCHGLDKTCAVTVDDADWWNATVSRMVDYKSDLFSADEAAAVGLFLADGKQRAELCSSN